METMKAFQMTKYTKAGDFDNVEYTENAKKPTIEKEDQVLIRVQRSCISSGDLRLQRGDAKMFVKLNFPEIMGVDMAGVVEEVGSSVTHLKVGDRVVGASIGPGGWAEYAVIDSKVVGKVPDTMSITRAGGLPTSIQTAFHCFKALLKNNNAASLRDGSLQDALKGQHIIINGASGGVGTCAVLLAKHLYGMTVWAVCSGKNHDVVTALGADHCIDYHKDDFQNVFPKDHQLAAVIDTVGNAQSRAMSMLNSSGTYILVGEGWDPVGVGFVIHMITNMVWRKVLSLLGKPKFHQVLFSDNGELIEEIYRFLDTNNLHGLIPIHDTVELKDIEKGLRIVDTHRTVGKLIVNVDGQVDPLEESANEEDEEEADEGEEEVDAVEGEEDVEAHEGEEEVEANEGEEEVEAN